MNLLYLAIVITFFIFMISLFYNGDNDIDLLSSTKDLTLSSINVI
jgi:hypothetical protein